MNNRKLILYISISLDGFLATQEDDVSWLSIVEQDGEDYGYSEFTQDVDTYIVGRKTYDTILRLTNGVFPQAQQFQCYVITREEREDQDGITFFNGKIEDLISHLKMKEGKNIYCDGGGQIVKLLMEKDLIDEYIISIIPIVLGDGKRLFMGGIDTLTLKATAPKYFDSGLVQLRYEKPDRS
ncbi:MAG: dihydrofolate reductase [Cyclobacteriaceae bacterium]|nr:dihydrofolate reductase [Cyclobacteriaceae bacterium HetDA_MAG_MS6]